MTLCIALPLEVRQADFFLLQDNRSTFSRVDPPCSTHAQSDAARVRDEVFPSPSPGSVPGSGGDAAASRSPGPRPPPSPAERLQAGLPRGLNDRAPFLTRLGEHCLGAQGGSPSAVDEDILGTSSWVSGPPGPALARTPACCRSPRRTSASRIASHCVRRGRAIPGRFATWAGGGRRPGCPPRQRSRSASHDSRQEQLAVQARTPDRPTEECPARCTVTMPFAPCQPARYWRWTRRLGPFLTSSTVRRGRQAAPTGSGGRSATAASRLLHAVGGKPGNSSTGRP